MNIKQADIILKKINRLYETMTLDENIDVFEQDLMLSYIRQLYEAFSPEEQKTIGAKIQVPPVPKVPVQEPVSVKNPEPLVEQLPEKKSNPSPLEKTPEAAEAKADPPQPVIEEKPVSKIENKKPEESASGTVNLAKPPASKTKSSKPDLEELFDHKQAKELSEKLSEMPIKDLTKSMGLNEKIYTINELFGGDGQAFDITIKTLNTFNSFDQARAYLSDNIAEKYGWTEKSRRNKAIHLIKLIRRRYN